MRLRVTGFIGILVLIAAVAVVPAYAAKPKCKGQKATIVGSGAADDLKGTKKADVIVSKGGDDTIDGKGGDDLICSGAGDDTVSGSAGNDTVIGGAGDDDLRGGAGSDTLNGGDGVDLCQDGEDLIACEDTGFQEFTFPDARLEVSLIAPIAVPVTMTGEVVSRVSSAVQDADGDGLEELAVEIVSAHFAGPTPVGELVITDRGVDEHPNQPTVGTIEETVNSTPGTVEIPAFGTGPGGLAEFDIYFEAGVAGITVHNHDPVTFQGAITQWPPAAGETLAGPTTTIPTFYESESGAPTGVANEILTLVP